MNIAEQFASRILGALNVPPDQIRDGFNGIVRDAALVRDEIIAAKKGFGATAVHFDQRLTALESKIDRLLFLCDPNVPAQMEIGVAEIGVAEIETVKVNGFDHA